MDRAFASLAAVALGAAVACETPGPTPELPGDDDVPSAPVPETEPLPGAEAAGPAPGEVEDAAEVSPPLLDDEEGDPGSTEEGPIDQLGEPGVLASIQPRSGSDVTGTVRLWEDVVGVVVYVEVKNATPGQHGVHIHEVVDCNAPDATSAGGHFNPRGEPHGLFEDEVRHLGDLGNITIDPQGEGTLLRSVEEATLHPGGELSFVGRALIVHAGEDTGEGEDGQAGARVGCAELLP